VIVAVHRFCGERSTNSLQWEECPNGPEAAGLREGATMRKITLPLATALIAACAHTSGVTPTGKGTYMVSRSHWGVEPTGSSVKAEALKEANSYCARLHKEMELVNETQNDMVPFKSEAQAEIEFRCR